MRYRGVCVVFLVEKKEASFVDVGQSTKAERDMLVKEFER